MPPTVKQLKCQKQKQVIVLCNKRKYNGLTYILFSTSWASKSPLIIMTISSMMAFSWNEPIYCCRVQVRLLQPLNVKRYFIFSWMNQTGAISKLQTMRYLTVYKYSFGNWPEKLLGCGDVNLGELIYFSVLMKPLVITVTY